MDTGTAPGRRQLTPNGFPIKKEKGQLEVERISVGKTLGLVLGTATGITTVGLVLILTSGFSLGY